MFIPETHLSFGNKSLGHFRHAYLAYPPDFCKRIQQISETKTLLFFLNNNLRSVILEIKTTDVNDEFTSVVLISNMTLLILLFARSKTISPT